jgi:hypothetical protein
MSPTLAPHVVLTETEHGAVLLDERSGGYWQLNPTGAAVVRHLDAGGTLAEVVADLRTRHADHADAIGADLDGFVRTLRSRGLITP